MLYQNHSATLKIQTAIPFLNVPSAKMKQNVLSSHGTHAKHIGDIHSGQAMTIEANPCGGLRECS